MKNIYKSTTYLEHNPNWHTEDSKWKSEKILQIMQKNNLQFTSLMEIGCGFGEILFWLSKSYNNVEFIGYDIADSAIQEAKQRFKEIEFKILDDPEKVNNTDVCLIIDVIEHVDNYYELLSKIKGKSDYFIFHIPLDISVKAIIRTDFIKSWQSVGHIHFFTKEIAQYVIEKAGFKIIDQIITKPAIEVVRKNFKKKMFSYLHRLVYPISPNFAIRVFGGYSIMILARPE